MNALGALLAWLHPSDRDFDLANQEPLREHFGSQVCEVVLAYLVQRNYDPATVLMKAEFMS